MLNNVKAVQKTRERVSDSINKLMELGRFRNEDEAFAVMKAVLLGLRDRLTDNEAIHLGSQLPALLRGHYYEGWQLNHQSTSRSKNEFLEEVRNYLDVNISLDLEKTVTATLKIILDMIDQSEAIDVIHQLPKEIQELCPGD